MQTPHQTIKELDKYIVGQQDAKRAVAIALRNRWRRAQLPEEIKKEISPKNILMIGPTGVGKTEIARRLAALADSPFVKVEATKFTEVGYVGRDVDSIIRDLADNAIKMLREEAKQGISEQAKDKVKEKILDALLPVADNIEGSARDSMAVTRNKFRQMLDEGKLEDREIDIEFEAGGPNVEIMGPPGMEDMTNQIQNMFQGMKSGKTKRATVSVKQARKIFFDEEVNQLINNEDIQSQAIEVAEQTGIVFIDEIDKVAKRQDVSGGDVSREGVQRDLLPLIEGSTISTKYGSIKTDHILFITSGAFHYSKPSDLIPELQGRLPIRVELSSLTVDDFVAILTDPEAALIKQYKALLSTENVQLLFEEDAIRRIAEIAHHVNETVENIGARRLYTVMERLLEQILFEADKHPNETFTVDMDYVNKQLHSLAENQDLSQYIL